VIVGALATISEDKMGILRKGRMVGSNKVNIRKILFLR
jgi:hypothetical protein